MQTLFNGFGQDGALMALAVASDDIGLFDVLRTTREGKSVATLAAELGFDFDRLQACLGLLERLGCVARGQHSPATFGATPQADELARVAGACRELLQADEVTPALDRHSHGLSLSRQRWHVSDPALAAGMDGLLLASLLCALPLPGLLEEGQEAGPWLAELPSGTAHAVGAWLTEQGWLGAKEPEGLAWTRDGVNLWTEVPAARVLLGHAKAIIQQGALQGLLKDEVGVAPLAGLGRAEIWRRLDGEVLGPRGESGGLAGVPACIVGWNGVHESDIRRVRERLLSRTKAAEVGHERSVRMVLVDSCPARLARSAAGQADVLTLVGDVTDPSSVVSQLSASAGLDPRHMLHMVDLRDGRALDVLAQGPALGALPVGPVPHPHAEPWSALYQRWLSRWSNLVSSHGLFVVQEHGGQADSRRGALGAPLHDHDRLWGGLQALLGCRVVSADEMLMLAASEGLFASPGLVVNAPEALPLTRLSLNRFERRDYRIRFAEARDVPELVVLERRCWGDELASSESVIRRRIDANPCGQVVLEVDGQVGGAMYTQRIHDEAGLMAATSDRVHALHAPDGHIIQLLAVNVQPHFQNRHWGDQLLEFTLQRCAVMDGVRRVAAVTRCKDRSQHSDVSSEDYIGLRNAQGRLVDSVLRFHELHGARIRELVPHYRPKDHVNQGHGVLVEYDIRRRRRDDLPIPSAGAQGEGLSADALTQLVVDAVQAVFKGGHDFSMSCPLMEMGLDSADLMQLAEDISCRVACALPATFFFEFNTCEKVIAALSERLGLADAASPETAPAAVRARDQDAVIGNDASSERDIAIVGVACSLPGGISDLSSLWDVLSQGREVVGAMPANRWRWPEGVDPAGAHRGIDRGSFIEDISLFDASFFRVSPREAELMDPQQRLLLELSWACIEDAGYNARALAGSATGVYVGASGSDYQHVLGQRREVEAHHGLSTSMAVLANRLSYFFDLNGPSLQIDTACSSSLVALHEAIRAMRDGTCQQALVAGINLMIHPATTIAFYKAGMLSKDGRCKTFDASADGYVRAEGAVVLMLKPLGQARLDGDHIHGVLKGSAVNHGGEAGGLTVPHPARQADLLVAAYKDAGIGPGRVGYIEAHGTGTSLGDPIEVRGLKDAFRRMSGGGMGTQPVGIGSIKTNVGHLEAAAGLGGVLKVLASMRHHVLPASLNFHQLNPQIDLEGTGLYVVDQPRPWHAEGTTLRCAGVSSFGSGGTNAHVVLEEPPRPAHQVLAGQPGAPVLVPLSAKSDAQLQRSAENLLAHLRRHKVDLPSVAYTLQVGRVPMPSRVAFVVRDDAELMEQLEAFCAGRPLSAGFVRASSGPGGADPSNAAWESDDDVLSLWQQWWRKGKLHRLAKAWVQGTDLAWESFHADARPVRVSLPTCVFARKRHWAEPSSAPLSAPASDARMAWLHPLLHRNTSDVAELKFTSRFDGKEFFLDDHVVRGERVLPAAAQLEMVFTAVRLSIADQVNDGVSISLHDLAFMRPIALKGEALDVHLVLDPDEAGLLSFELFSHDEERQHRVVHSQGRVSWHARSSPTDEVLDLKGLRQQQATPIEVEGCYQALDRIGLVYGAGFRALANLRIVHQPRGRDSALADVEVPASVRALSSAAYHLHPSVVDAALQASLALILHAGGTDTSTLLPFAIESVEVLHATPARGVALVTSRPGEQDQGAVRTLDVDIADNTGRVCLRLRGLVVRVVGASSAPKLATLMMAPHWMPVDMGAAAGLPRHGRHLLILCECGESSPAGLDALASQGLGRVDLVHFSRAEHEGLAQAYTRYACELLALVQDALTAKRPGPTLVQLVVPDRVEKRPLAGLHGLLKSASQESPRLTGQLLWIEDGRDPRAWAALASLTGASSHNGEWRVHDGAPQVRRLQELAPVPGPTQAWWRDEAVYLITGGAGGLGAKFARNMAQQAKGLRLVLVGRSAFGPAQQTLLDELGALGARVSYESMDTADAAQVRALVDRVVAREGAIHGVLHCAGVLKDSFVVRKTRDELKAVFAPKVQALLALDEATRKLPLECFVVFGSTSGVLGNVGQSDYAAANAFADGYAAYRQSQVDAGLASGRTLAIDWPLWADGGMQVDPLTRRRLWDQSAQVPLASEAGLLALGQALACGQPQVVVMQGDDTRLRDIWLSDPIQTVASASELAQATAGSQNDAGDRPLHGDVVRELRALLVSTLKLPPEQVDAQASFDRFGLDSMLALELVSALEKPLGPLPKTLFFEHQSLNALADFLVAERAKPVQAWVGGTVKRDPAAEQAVAPAAALPAAQKPFSPLKRKRLLATSSARKPEGQGPRDIAIIGLSGRYPKARSLGEYWANLLQGLDCVSEIPADRWDHRDYFEESRGQPGKSYSKWGAFIDGVDEFDPLFFNISPREAVLMDPQERLFLQCAHAAMEDAGYTREALCAKHQANGLPGNVGVFVGVMWNEYQLYGAQTGKGYALQGHVSSIANRVSYCANFHGPSMAVDTMCSSSLTAIHLACQSIHSGGCEVAIAGGVNVSIHPNKYLALAQGMFVASDGLCKSFGQGGDGYVPGEGVGAVLLKPLDKALADGDQIHGVIKASAVNHGGKTSGYTVPNPSAQAQVISMALKESGVSARAVSYVEAHGTGTALGDPIEIAGLSKAFSADTADKGYCAIGSAKSNIGHCESAAGIAGLAKVLLQMKHQMLVPSLHSRHLNEHIDFERTPFVVQRELAPWARPRLTDGEGDREGTRIAGLSSFGAGGANAHLIIEEHPEYRPQGAVLVTQERPAVVLLSGKDEERLKEQVTQLLRMLEAGEVQEGELADVAYTLQVGREAHGHRLACVVGSLKDLRDKLAAHASGQALIEGLYQQDIRQHKDDLSTVLGQEDLARLRRSWIEEGQVHKLAQAWVRGLSMDWHELYGVVKPRRISLPTYPFAKERYWMETKTAATSAPVRGVGEVLHPLVQRNTSDVKGLRYSATLSGNEFFLADHLVQGRKVLPAVAHLEMARHAASLALGQPSGQSRQSRVLEISDVVFSRPVLVGEGGVQLHIALRAQEGADHGLAFEICSEQGGQEVVHSQGRAALLVQPVAAQEQDLNQLQGRCAAGLRMDAPQSYAVFDRLGLSYGERMRSLQQLACGVDEQGRAMVLGRLQLGAWGQAGHGDYVMHPSLMDAALQTSMGLQAGEADGKTMLPFALERVQVFKAVPARAWSWVRHARNSRPGQPVHKLDIDVLDEKGQVCVSLQGYSARMLDGQQTQESVQTLLLHPEWVPQTGQAAALQETSTRHERHLVVMAPGLGEAARASSGLLAQAQAHLPQAQWVWLLPQEGSPAERYEAHAQQLLAQLQAVLASRPSVPVLVQLVFSAQERELSGLAGLLKSVGLESPKLSWQIVEHDGLQTGAALAQLLETQARVAHVDREVRRGPDGTVKVRRLREAASAGVAVQALGKPGGVYLITGGLGGLGRIFAREVAQDHGNVVLVMTGRSPLAKDDERVQALRALGARVEYWAVDVTQATQVKGLVQGVLHRHGKLDGVIHSAGILQDSFALRKTAQELSDVFAPKVKGLNALDEATRELSLDYFVAFSSVAGEFGNLGQADYAAANAYMDEYMHERARRVGQGLGTGRSLSVNWPLWAQGGMHVDEGTLQRMRKEEGIEPLGTESGVKALGQALSLGLAQVVVMSGHAERIRRMVLQRPVVAGPVSKPEPAPVQARPTSEAPNLQLEVQVYLKGMLASGLSLAAERIDSAEALEHYGITSVLALEFVGVLEQKFGKLSKTLFFEYQSIEALAAYFVDEHADKLDEVLGRRVQAQTPVMPVPASRNDSTGVPAPLEVRVMTAQAEAQARAEAQTGLASEAPGLQLEVQTYLKNILASGLSLAAEQIDSAEALEHYGIDSVLAVEFVGLLEQKFGKLSKTLFFEYQTIDALAGYFIDAHAAKLGELLGWDGPRPGRESVNAPTHVTPSLHAEAQAYLKGILASGLSLAVEHIDSAEALEHYGIDSVLAVEFVGLLEQKFGKLSKTLFFEYQTIDALAGYFIDAHAAKLGELLGRDARAQAPATQAAASVAARATAVAAQAPPVVQTLAPSASAPPAPTSAPGTTPAATSSVSPGWTGGEPAKASARPAHAGALDIAIIGISGRYPQARTLKEYWRNLTQGMNCITEIPSHRWNVDRYFDPRKGTLGKSYSKWGGFIDGMEDFDPLFFNISPREAQVMDPQERVFMQCVHETLEDAGYTRQSLAAKHHDMGMPGNVGVFVGAMWNEYQLYSEENPVPGSGGGALSGNLSSIANRISYYCNFHGPSLAVDTMCSSSLTAIHLACQNILMGSCEVAIAGGVNLTVHPYKYLVLAQGQFVSSEGLCKSFGQGGDGYVPGEGVGAVLLKPLHKALEDGDQIHGVIKGCAVNHGGKTNGYTVPNPHAQTQVIAKALKESGVNARAVSYIEAHGTGTSLGDPIEIAGLSKAYGAHTRDRAYCAIGSAKSSIGHCESAAGMAGLSKVLLQMKHQMLAPNLHSRQLNEHIDFDSTPFVVQQELAPWPRPRLMRDGQMVEGPRIAGLSSFGAGGANAHLIIEEHPEYRAKGAVPVNEHSPAVVVLSGKDEGRLREQARQLLEVLEAGDLQEEELCDVAYTLQVGREALGHRLACVTSSLAVLKRQLAAYVGGQASIDQVYLGEVKGRKDVLPVAGASPSEGPGQAHELAQRWTQGQAVDWSGLHGQARPRRISLPTYPFARIRYWIDAGNGSRTKAPVAAPANVEDPGVAMSLAWVSRPLDAAAAVFQPAGKVIVLFNAATKALAEAITGRLGADRVLPMSEEALASHTRNLDWMACHGLIDLVGCGEAGSPGLGWIELVQKLVESGPDEGLRLLGVTKGLEAHQNPRVNLSGASRAALYRLLSTEYARLRSSHVDLDPLSDTATLAAQVLDEFMSDTTQLRVCRRATERWEAMLAAAAEAAPHQASASPISVDPDHVVWVTGGTRGIGLACAQHLVKRHGVKRLVLSGREAFPPVSTWAGHAAGTDALARKIQAIRDLEGQGVRVHVASVDLSDLAAVKREVDVVERTMGPIGGLIHSAGLIDTENPAFVRKTLPGIARVLAPKVEGLNHLMDGLTGQPLKFALLFSSVSGLIPSQGVGQSDYAMANAFMDHAAQAWRQQGRPVTSIQWGNWREVGMGVVRSSNYARAGLTSHSNPQGFELLDRVLAGRVVDPVVMMATVDRQHWRPDQLLRRAEISPPQQPSRPAPSRLPEAASVAQSIEGRAGAWLKQLLSEHLRMDASLIELDVPLQDYGADSVRLAQVMQQVARQVKAEALDPSLLYEYPTVGAFVQWLVKAHGSDWLPATAGASAAADRNSAPAARTEEPPALAAKPPELVATPAAGLGDTDIVVVGLSARFPGADDLDGYWRLLSEGRSAIRHVPGERWGVSSGYAAGVIEDAWHFDAQHFMISEADAEVMDAQALLVLEETLRLFCHAGYAPQDLKGQSIGVYVGGRTQHEPDADRLALAPNPILAVGANYLAANVSRHFDLRGPSLVVDSACSSAMVAMNMAVQSLRSGEVSAAVVGGVNVLASDRAMRLFSQRGILSREPAFHIFDPRAQGAVLGDGVGLVLLKTLAQAQADGDRIYAVLKGLSVNNDGRTAGPAAPNVQAQKDVMLSALAKSGLSADQVGHIDVNGSGSQVTDLLELKAIQAVYRSTSTRPCGLGSMKPNIGHPLCAESIASFIKVVLMLHHRQMVPFLSAEQPMAHYDLGASPFVFHRQAAPWEEASPVAAINSFADGGTNAHALLQAWPTTSGYEPRRGPLAPPRLNKTDVRRGRQAGLWAINDATVSMSTRLPLIRDHQVQGVHLLPGLAYIDLVHQWLSEQGHRTSEVVLRNLVILRPLAPGADADVEVVIRQSPMGEGVWGLSVLRVSPPQEPAVCHMTAEVHLAPPVAFDDTLDVHQVAQSASARVSLDDIYADARRRGLVHQGSMLGQGLVHLGQDACVVQCRLAEPAALSLGQPLLSPTLLDACCLALLSVMGQKMGLTTLEGEPSEQLLLPLVFDEVRFSGPLRGACLARTRWSGVQEKGELKSLMLEFFNEAGRKVGEFEGLVKLVRPTGSLQTDPAVANGVHQPDKVTEAHAEGLEAGQLALDFVRGLFATKLGKRKALLDVHAGYYELGLNSVAMLELVTSIGDALGESMSPTLLFEYTSLKALGDYLARHHGAQLARLNQVVVPVPVAAQVPDRAPQAGTARPHDIAIVALAGRYPRSRTLKELWANLSQGVDCVGEVPAERWEAQAYFDERKGVPGRSYCKWGGFIDGVDEFDSLYFNIAPSEAQVMDPQGRLFLETVAEVLESGGYTRGRLRESQARVGVYVGAMYQQYRGQGGSGEQEAALAVSSYSSMANRVSYFFGFEGPSIAIDTMCSSSTVAIHQACKDLILGECDMAVAGGVNLSIDPRKYLGLSQMQLLGSALDSRSFSDGDGYLPSEGVGAVLLKPLHQAVADGDPILAVIKGSATNHSGPSSGYSVPSPGAQAKVMESCLSRAGVDKASIGYVEASANGSSLGDAVEASALRMVFGGTAQAGHRCVLGSVKSNLGHPEAVSGMAQLAKVVLQMAHGQTVPTLQPARPNPALQLDGTPLVLEHALAPWPRALQPDGHPWPRRALINSFAAGGTYAALVVEEYVAPEPSSPSGHGLAAGPQVFVLSARNEDRLRAKAEALLAHLRADELIDLEDLAHTLQSGREPMPCRLAWVAQGRQAVLQALQDHLKSDKAGVKLYTGHAEEDQGGVRHILEGAAGVQFVQGCIERGELDRLADYWAGGGEVDWGRLHQGRSPRFVALPTYPFERRRHWVGATDIASSVPALAADAEDLALPQRMVACMKRLLAKNLGLAESELKEGRPLREYGLDSLHGLRLIRHLSEVFGIEVSGRDLLEHGSMAALAAHLARKRLPDTKQAVKTPPPSAESPPSAKASQLALLRTFRAGLIEIDEVESLLREELKNETA